MKNVEILAPVGDKEMLMTAIANHADAVYLGLENFNARAKAENFNSDNIRETIKTCHLFGIKVYITVNTLVSNSEMDFVVGMIEKAYKAKADAFIIQDLGLAYVLKKTFPNIEMHASTQMGVCNERGAKVLEELGFKRVVVARETTLEDIRRIKENTSLEIEAFIQGALCVCYSGSCYISSLLKNKSGNRGQCLQLCRLPYKLVKNGQIKKQGYLLSPRDISFISRLKDMIDAGVTSLKIEGRLRRPAYLAQSLISVRNILENKSNVDTEDYNLKKVFSRGDYNKGVYFNSKVSGGIINSEINNHLGVEIGKVINVKPFKDIYKITINSKHDITVGDGLKFIDKSGQSSMGVGSVNKNGDFYEVYGKTNPKVASIVYLTVDYKNEQKLLENKNILVVDVEIEANHGEPIRVNLECNGLKITHTGEILEKAQKQAISHQDFINCFKKTGSDFIEVENIKVITSGVFIAKSQLNKERRIAFEKLIDAIIENFENKNIKNFKKIPQNKSINIHNNTNFNYYIVDNAIKLETLNDLNSRIIYAPLNYTFDDINKVSDMVLKKYNSKVILYLPVVANFRDLNLIESLLEKIKNKIDIAAGSHYGLYYTRQGYNVVAMMNNNIANDYSVLALKSLGVENFVSSIEKNLFKKLLYAHEYIGNPALMTLVMCPFIEHTGSSCENCKYDKSYNLVMQDGTDMKIRRTKINDCYFELYQNKKITIPKGNGYVIDLRN